uniref:Uncharacterized protein n=1 Tax=Sus scrofa TaxID=9823 RepID=A0A8D1GLH7_PIG
RSGIAVSCGVGRRRGSDPALLWLWCRPVATAPIGPLAWEPPYAAKAAQENSKKTKKKKKSLASLVQEDHSLLLIPVSGKKARTFDLEAMFEQTRRTAVERSRKTLAEPVFGRLSKRWLSELCTPLTVDPGSIEN